MTWIADAISQRRASILDGVSGLLPDLPGGSPFRKEELLEQASFTLDMLGDALRSRDISHLFTKWEAIGSACAQRDVPMDEIPNVPDLVKRSAWALLSKLVGEGDIELDRLVEGMMEVEKVLSDCWFALVRSYLQTEDVALVARNDHIEALYSLTEVLSSEGEESIYQNIVDKVAGITGLPRCSLLLLDDDGRLVPTASNYVDALEKLNRLDERTIDALSVASYAGMPVVLEKDENTRPGIRDFLDGYHSPVVLAVPMKSGDKSSGLLLLDAEHKGEFTWEQVDLAVASASQATMAIEKSELLSQMESRLKHMAAIGINWRASSRWRTPC
jgi:hypothetical protein